MESTTAAPAPTGHMKQYVFVDEYNRHKRLKVMRACDGCRKRKIRCDGALQNGPWPCGACVRLKLKCVPPTLDGDEDQQSSITAPGQTQFSVTTTSSTPTDTKPDGTLSGPQRVQDWAANVVSPAPSSLPGTSAPPLHSVESAVYSSQFYSQPLGPRLDPGYQDDQYFASSQFRPAPSLLRSQTEASGSSGGDPQEVNATVKELAEQMGDLSIETSSVAPWVINEKKTLAETPAIEEVEIVLPPSVGTDTTVRIPPEMMPSDDRVMDYFGYFFTYVHPYVPVLHRSALYEQWRSARHSISPLLLEGIFACVARYLEDPVEVRRWLALAARHEESFKDVPRLSTIQAMILLTKAREAVLRRGYYYRSWMAVKYMTTMAVDLSLHEHCDQHRTVGTCKFSKADCMVRTRIWQTLFNLEILVGAPQGRSDFAVELETLDLDIPDLTPDMDSFEYQTSRRFTYLAQVFSHIKVSNALWQSMRRHRKDWALDPAFVRNNEELATWLNKLPSDMQLQYLDDGSPPWLGGDHFVAYVHAYYHLVIIMHHRPQLQQMLEKRDPSFKTHLDICLESAVKICRVQEALIRDFGLHGLQFMQRGLNFTIYCVLTCTMLHLAAITSPDPILNSRARIYFTRHMRVLEQCISSASPDLQMQINTLREAFSQDINKPFELKASLGLRSPTMETNPTPPELRHSPLSASAATRPPWPHLQDTTSSKTLSPASEYGHPFEHAVSHSLSQPTLAYHAGSFQPTANTGFATHALHQVTSAPQVGYALEPSVSNEQQQTPVWDPSGIFQQWNSAFGGQSTAPPQVTPPDPRLQPTSAPVMPQQHSPTSQQALYGNQLPTNAGALLSENAPVIPTVTPVMWQDAFTSAYVSGHGQKRYREGSVDHSAYGQYPKRRG